MSNSVVAAGLSNSVEAPLFRLFSVHMNNLGIYGPITVYFDFPAKTRIIKSVKMYDDADIHKAIYYFAA